MPAKRKSRSARYRHGAVIGMLESRAHVNPYAQQLLTAINITLEDGKGAYTLRVSSLIARTMKKLLDVIGELQATLATAHVTQPHTAFHLSHDQPYPHIPAAPAPSSDGALPLPQAVAPHATRGARVTRKTKDELLEENTRLRAALSNTMRSGAAMSGICFNMAQKDYIPELERDAMKREQKAWDEISFAAGEVLRA